MSEYVLVAGAWLGAWAWDDVAAELRAAGHGVHPLTLSGLADRRDAPDVGQQTHVQDVVSAVDEAGLRDVVLVGHSYAGIPVGQAAARIGDRLRRVVFVDANVPADGVSFAGTWSPAGQEILRRSLADNDGFWPPLTAEDYKGQDLSDEQIAWIVAGSTPHPGATLTEPAVMVRPLAGLPATYIKCVVDGAEPTSDVARLLTSESWSLSELATGHWPMVSQPGRLAAILLDAAR